MGGTINLAMVHFYTNSLSSKKFLLCSMKMKHKADRKSFSYPKIDKNNDDIKACNGRLNVLKGVLFPLEKVTPEP